MDPIATRKLGSSPLRVTQLGFGSAPLSGFRGFIPEEEAGGTIRTAYDAGLRLFDTAPYYGYGRSEHRVGHVLRQLPRDSFVLSTKVGRVLLPVRRGDDTEGLRPGGLPFRDRFDYSRDGTMRSIEQSMARLGITEIDILLVHDADIFMHKTEEAADRAFREAMAGCIPTLRDLRSQGVIKAVGVGLNRTEASIRFAKEADIDCILLAGRYTLLEQHSLDELLPICEQKDIGIMLGGPYNSGILATGAVPGAKYDYGDAPAEILERVARIDAVCRRHGVPMKAAALQFPLGHPKVASIIPGAMSRAEVLENVALFRVPIPTDLWAELKHEKLVRADAPVPS